MKITASNLLEMNEDARIAILKSEVEGIGSKYILIGKIAAIVDRSRGDSGTLMKYLAAKIPGMTTQKLGHGYKAAGVYTAMVEDGATVGSGKITEEDYDACLISWMIPAYAVINALEKDAAKYPAEKHAEVRERIAVILRTRPDAATALLDLIKGEIVPKAEKGDGGNSAKEKELAEKLAAKEKELADGQAAHDKWKAEAEENGKRLIARIAELEAEKATMKERIAALETSNGQLSEVAGMLAAFTTEDMHVDLMPKIAALPETARTTLLSIVETRLAALNELEPANTGGTLLIEDAA